MSFEKIRKKLGFGCMRFPLNEDKTVNTEELKQMIDYYMESGFNYFDTARGYVNGMSESALKECLVKRYPRDSYVLVDKLSTNFFKCEDDILPLFESQLYDVGVEYFDFYLMHAQSREADKKYTEANAYEIAKKLKSEGKIKHIGISFHDTPDALEEILKKHPEIEIVQLQFNYYDYEDKSVQSKKCYEICLKYAKPVIVMEPLRGGALARLNDETKNIFLNYNENMSPASYAIRFAASFENVIMVLSGMSKLSDVKDNAYYMKDFEPLNEAEQNLIKTVLNKLKNLNTIKCTACEYCLSECPKKIKIPSLFDCYNKKKQFKSWNCDFYYEINTKNNSKASDCIKCGKCEDICPQKLNIRELLSEVAKEFEKDK